MLSRRGIFGFLAAAPAAVKGLAKDLGERRHFGGVARPDGPLPLFGEVQSGHPGFLRSRAGDRVIDMENGTITFTIRDGDKRPMFVSGKSYLANADDFDGVGCA